MGGERNYFLLKISFIAGFEISEQNLPDNEEEASVGGFEPEGCH